MPAFEPFEFEEFHMPRWKELPAIDLYLDQVVTLIDVSLDGLFLGDIDNPSGKEAGTVITKTMINNYVKNNLVDAPVKKKYGRTQLAKLFVVCILKQVYSMAEICSLMELSQMRLAVDVSYDKFCDMFEEALFSIIAKTEDRTKCKCERSDYLLNSVILSCAYKLFVDASLEFGKRAERAKEKAAKENEKAVKEKEKVAKAKEKASLEKQ